MQVLSFSMTKLSAFFFVFFVFVLVLNGSPYYIIC